MGVVLRISIMCFALLALVSGAPVGAASEPVVLQPSSSWQLDFADDSCRLGREFGTGDDRTLLYFERYAPGDGFYLVVAGEPLRILGDRERAQLRFGPAFGFHEAFFRTGSMGDLQPAMIVSSWSLDRPEPSDDDRSFAAPPLGEGPDGQRITADQEKAVEWLDVTLYPGARSVRLATGSMGKPLAAMRDCTQELMTHWGIDVEAHRHLSRRAEALSSPGTWMSSNDFPRAALFAGERALVFFRLGIDTNGKIDGCHIQHSTGREEFEAAVCKAISRNGEFSPALDAAGKPIASYWISSVAFDYPSPGSGPFTGTRVRK